MSSDILPDDVLLAIFKNLDSKSILAASRVCTSWHRVSRDASLWSCLDLEPFHNSLDEPTMLRVLSSFFVPLGTRLSLNKCVVTSGVLRLLMTQCPKLHTLSLLACKFPTIGSSMEYWNEVCSLKVMDLRWASGYPPELQHILTTSSQLECLALDSCVGPRLSFNVLYNKSKLRILECRNSEWIDDSTIQTMAGSCPLLESLSVACCSNVQGYSLQFLLMSCLNLTTLVLACTSLKDRAAIDTDWQLSIISELDVMGCHQLGTNGLSVMLTNLSHLRYLKCALTDDNLRSLQPRGERKLEVLQLHRQYPITLKYVSRWLSICPQMRCLDVASIPLNSEYFEVFLPNMPALQTLNFAGYKVLGLEDIIFLLAKHCLSLEAVSINFYHSANDTEVKQAFVVLIQRCKRLKKITLSGLFVTDLVAEVIDLARYSCRRTDIAVRENDNFMLPRPSLSVENMVRI